MGYYVAVIEIALTYFPLVSVMFIVPYLTVQYRRYGQIHSSHMVINLLAIYYLLTVFCLVNLPFPDTLDYIVQQPQLKAFDWWSDFQITQRAIGSWSFLAIISNSVIYQQFFNIIMFIPLGVYLRYYKRQQLLIVTLEAFLFSLILEVIQLSGFFFLFPGAYRIFDVDDLITNTLGGVVGFFLGAIPEKYYPLGKRYSPGVVGDVSMFPKALSTLIDLGILWGANSLLFLLLGTSQFIAFITAWGYFVGVPMITKGETLGRWCLQIKLLPSFGRKKELLLKDVIIKHIPVLLLVQGYYFFTITGPTLEKTIYSGLLTLGVGSVIVYITASMMKREQVLFDRWSGLRVCPKNRQKPLSS